MSTFFAKRLRPAASLPYRGSHLAAGLDLSAAEEAVVPKGSKAIVKTGLSIAVPHGTYARLAPRSGLAVKHMLDVGAGVVDADYRGEVGVVLFNHGPEDFAVRVGDRVAQLVVEQVDMSACEEVEDLDHTDRGCAGFGSTGTDEPVEVAPEKKKKARVEMLRTTLRAKRLRPEASLPIRGSELAAGFDLAAVEAVVVPAGGKAIAKTGLSVAVPTGTYARIAPRSGLAAKHMIHCGAGVVDADYRGEVGVVLFNFGADDFTVNLGDRVAQMILEKIAMVECKEVDSLDDTERGAGGFGSTGISQQSYPELSPQEIGNIIAPLLVKRLAPEAKLLVRGSAQAAGFDLSAAVATSVPAHGKAIVKTGLTIATPLGTYARIAPRSGLAAKHMLHCGAGVVDADYRGEVGVVLFNHGSTPFEVAAGDRVAQLILEKISMLECVETTSLEDTLRGAGGFGSTGISNTLEAALTKSSMVVDGTSSVLAHGGGGA